MKTLFLNLVFPDSADKNKTIENGNVSNKYDIEGRGNITTLSYSKEFILHELLFFSMY